MRILAILLNSLCFSLFAMGAFAASGPVPGGSGPEQGKLEAENVNIRLTSSGKALFIELEESLPSDVKVYIFNVAFGEIFQGEMDQHRKRIDFGQYPTGLYYVRLQRGEEVYIKKVVKQK